MGENLPNGASRCAGRVCDSFFAVVVPVLAVDQAGTRWRWYVPVPFDTSGGRAAWRTPGPLAQDGAGTAAHGGELDVDPSFFP